METTGGQQQLQVKQQVFKQFAKGGKQFEKKDKAPHSREFMRSFRPVRLFLQAFGRFPYKSTQNENGTCTFEFKHKTPVTFVFYITTGIAAIMFLFINIGFMSLYIDEKQRLDYHEDKCGHTWETFTLYRYIVIVSLVYSWLVLTFVSSIDTYFHTKEYVNYLNIWSKSVQSMDMNVTKGATWTGMSGNLEFLAITILLTILFFAGLVPSLQDGLAVTALSMVRTFRSVDICSTGERGFYTGQEYIKFSHNKNLCIEDSHCKYSAEYHFGRIIGFLLLVYGLYGSRSSIVQFKFFCSLLTNASYTWNQRFRNFKSGGKSKGIEQERKRCDSKSLLHDHLTIVQLYKSTEDIFGVVLPYYYAIQLINLVMQLYYFVQLTYPQTCDEFWDNAESSFNCSAFHDFHVNQSTKDRTFFGRNQTTISFSNPCEKNENKALIFNALVGIFLLFQTLFLFIDTTMDGTFAHEEAMRGFEVLRRCGFMHSNDKHERNFIHSLVISFARNNPIHISPRGYIALNRNLVINILGAAFGFWIIIIQFRPGEISIEFDTLGFESSCPDNCTGCCYSQNYGKAWPGKNAFENCST